MRCWVRIRRASARRAEQVGQPGTCERSLRSSRSSWRSPIYESCGDTVGAAGISRSSIRRRHWGLKEHGGKSLISTYFINVPPVRVSYRAVEMPAVLVRGDCGRRTKNLATSRQSHDTKTLRHPGANRPQKLQASETAHVELNRAVQPVPRNAPDRSGSLRPAHRKRLPHTLGAGKTAPR